eukprot:215512-Chlamydomonas_euryale.AAC.1
MAFGYPAPQNATTPHHHHHPLCLARGHGLGLDHVEADGRGAQRDGLGDELGIHGRVGGRKRAKRRLIQLARRQGDHHLQVQDVRCSSVQQGEVRCSSVAQGEVRCSSVQQGEVRCGAVRYSRVGYGAVEEGEALHCA